MEDGISGENVRSLLIVTDAEEGGERLGTTEEGERWSILREMTAERI